jgi:hypothetical protein
MNLRRVLARILTRTFTAARWRRSRVVAIQCNDCHQWHKPRHIQLPNIICPDCAHHRYLAARRRVLVLPAPRLRIKPQPGWPPAEVPDDHRR